MARPTDEIMAEFEGLECELSPENLHCDGEASAEYVQHKLNALQKRWAELEKELGRKVYEGEGWNYMQARRPKKNLGRPY